MFAVLLNTLINFGSAASAQSDDTYKILFFSLLGLVMISAGAFLIYKKLKQIILFFQKAILVLKKYTSKVYAGLLGLLPGPIAGFAYSKDQDIFYSTLNAWQRGFGYSRLYDEAAPHFSMIVDSEPVYFDYDGRMWLIEFWKGQYGITTGCEVGVYNTKRSDFNIPMVSSDMFYDCADDDDMLFISYTLSKNGQVLFKREGLHWWLTGFKLGEFSQPSELVMNISLTLKSKAMLHAFMGGIRETGYYDSEISINENTVSFVFSQPRSTQPHSRSELENFMQNINKQNFETFRELTQDYNSTASKIAVIRKQEPSIYRSIMNLGGSKKLSHKFGTMRKMNRQ